MAFNLVGQGNQSGTGSVSTSAGATTTGATLVYGVVYDAGATGATPTDTAGNLYTRCGTTLTTGNGDKVELWKCPNSTGNAANVASQGFAGFNNFSCAFLVQLTGVDAASFDVTNQGNSASPVAISTGALGQAVEYVVAICGMNAGVSTTNTYSSGNSTILGQETNAAIFWTGAISVMTTAATTAVAPSFTSTQGTAGGAVVATFKITGGTAPAAKSKELSANGPGVGPSKIGQFSPALRAKTTPSPDVTISITGVQANGQVGNVSVSSTSAALLGFIPTPGPGPRGPFNNRQFLPALRGLAPTSPNVTISITGVQATGQVGNVAPSMAVAVTGVQATGQVGNVTPGIAIALTGNPATGQVGNVTPSMTVAATGVQATGQVGNVTLGIAVALTGNPATGQVGNVTPALALGVTGVQATGQVGSVSVGGDVTISITGVQATGQVGNVAPALAVAVTGNAATGQVGNVAPALAIAATGVQATGQVGNVAVNLSVSLTGLAATGQVGNVGPVNRTLALTGVTGVGIVGSVSPSGGTPVISPSGVSGSRVSGPGVSGPGVSGSGVSKILP